MARGSSKDKGGAPPLKRLGKPHPFRKVVSVLASVTLAAALVPVTPALAVTDQGTTQLVAATNNLRPQANVATVSVVDTKVGDDYFKTYVEWSDASDHGKIKWTDVTLLKSSPDDQGVVFWFYTNPDTVNHANEVTCSFIDWAYEEGKQVDVVVPSTVEATVNGENRTFTVTEMGPVQGTQGEAGMRDDANFLSYWYDPIDDFVPYWFIEKKHGTYSYGNPDDITQEYAVEHPMLNTGSTNADIGSYETGRRSVSDTTVTLPQPYAMAKSLTIPASITRITGQCFNGWGFSEVTFEEGSLEAGTGLRSITNSAFRRCNNLEELVLPSTFQSYGLSDGVRGGYYTYENRLTTDERFDETLHPNYGKWATDGTGTTLSDTPVLKTTGGGAQSLLYDNSGTSRLQMPSSCKIYMEMGGFLAAANALSRIDIVGGDETVEFISGNASVKAKSFGGALYSEDGSKILAGLPGAKSITIANTATDFSGLSNLKTTLQSIEFEEGLEEIPASAFKEFKALKTVSFPASLKVMGSSTLQGCEALTEVTFPEQSLLSEVPASTFSSLTSLRAVSIPDSVVKLGQSNFLNCPALECVDLGSGCKVISGGCFTNCKSLKQVVFGYDGEFEFDNKFLKTSDGTYVARASLRAQGSTNVANSDPIDSLDLYFTGGNASIKDEGYNVTGTTTFKNVTDFIAKNINVYAASESIKSFFTISNASAANQDHFAPKVKNATDYSSLRFYSISSAKSMSDVCSASIAEDVIFDGVAKEPAVTVNPKDSSVTLAEGADYEIGYSDNVNAGVAKATVKGLGVYYLSDPIELEFNIAPASIEGATVAEIANQIATGDAIEPDVSATIKLDGSTDTTLTADDFDISYSDNVLPGTATVTLTGKGNYTGTKTATFTIEPTAEQAAAAQAVAGKAAEVAAGTATDAELVAAYDALDDAAKAAVDGKTSAAVVAAQQRIADAAAEEAAKAAEEAEKAIADANDAKAKAEQAASDSAAQAEQAKKDAEAQKKAADEASAKAAAAEQTAKDEQAKAAQLQKAADAAKAAQATAEEQVASAKAAQETAEKAAASSLKKNTMTVKANTVKAKAKKKTTVKKAKAFAVKGAKGKVAFYKVSGNAKITVSKAGKVTVKKGLKKGKTYKVKVLVSAAGNKSYAPSFKTVTLKVEVAK